MQLVISRNKGFTFDAQNNDCWYIHQIRQSGNIIRPDRAKVGGYYIYKEKHGMVCLVKILEDTSKEDWIGFRMMVKRVFYSHWQVPKNCVFETGYHAAQGCPSAWHLEPAMELLDNKAV